MRRSGSGPPRSEGRTTRRTRTCSTSRRPCIGLRNPTKANGECTCTSAELRVRVGELLPPAVAATAHARAAFAGRPGFRDATSVSTLRPAPAVLADRWRRDSK